MHHSLIAFSIFAVMTGAAFCMPISNVTISEDFPYFHEVTLCFLEHRYDDVDCSAAPMAEELKPQAVAYQQKLKRYNSYIDYCLAKVNRHEKLPRKCLFVDDSELVEHCFQYHQLVAYEPCRGISHNRPSYVKSARQLYRTAFWYNITDEVHEEIDMELYGGDNSKAALVRYCMYNTAWIHHANHECYNITSLAIRGKPGHSSNRDTQWAIKKFEWDFEEQLVKDCYYYHQTDKLPPCKGISWQAFQERKNPRFARMHRLWKELKYGKALVESLEPYKRS